VAQQGSRPGLVPSGGRAEAAEGLAAMGRDESLTITRTFVWGATRIQR